jgi:thioredoxin reductase/NAD-dependent dihydropyrimidine dehydrogenase PreA subunit
MPDVNFFAIFLYGLPVVAFVVIHIVRRMRRSAADAKELAAAEKAGLAEPVSLHPVVDPSRCVGSGTCVNVCPESALGIIDGKARLTNPAVCIGHGACAAACPVTAITLVFGSERRGVDIPRVNPNFETNVPGIFIAGELGGMGLIRKAAEQGKQAIETIAARKAATPLDVVIIGAGPAGIASGLGAIHRKLRYRLIEQEKDLGGAILHYPRNKIAMTSPVELPIVGRLPIGEISKEQLLQTWQDVVDKSGLKIDFDTRMERLTRTADGFRVETTNGTFESANILLAIGRRGTPRKLDVPGEELSKVVYRLIEPEQYRGRRVLVVGGGDSAVECALACSAQPGTTVVLAYRGAVFNRIKPANRQRLEEAGESGRIDIRLKTEVKSVAADRVELVDESGAMQVENDVVVVQAGGVLPTALLRDLGVTIETKFGTA